MYLDVTNPASCNDKLVLLAQARPVMINHHTSSPHGAECLDLVEVQATCTCTCCLLAIPLSKQHIGMVLLPFSTMAMSRKQVIARLYLIWLFD